MNQPFNAHQGLILVPAQIDGPSGSAIVRLALDTGATTTVINVGLLVAIGYDPALASNRVQISTCSGIEFVPRIVLARLTALGEDRIDFPVLCHTLPPSTGVDGLLGLDVFRGMLLNIDFRTGQLSLT